MRWKYLGFFGKISSNVSKESYSFKSLKCPPAIEEMEDFKLDLMNIIKNLQFKMINNMFQKQLNSNIGQIKTIIKSFR